MKRRIMIISVFIALNALLFAQEKLAGGILYGDNWACMVEAPENWIMDQESFAPYGIYGLFYEDGRELGGNTPIVYINTNKLSDESDKALKTYISSDTKSYKSNGFTVKKHELKSIQEKQVFVYEFSKGNDFEICAYTRFKDCCFLIILTAHDEKNIRDNIPKLEFVINSMKYMDVKLNKE